MTAPSEPKKPIGELGEDFVEWACQSPLGRDFLFRGQKYRDGANEIELCDLLVLLDDTVILMEVKTADREKRPNRTEQEWADWANARLKKALSQLERGVKAIRGGLVRTVENDRQGETPVDPSQIKHFYGITVVDHPELDVFGCGPVIDGGDGLPVSVLTTTHTELRHLLAELSTPADLIDYMQAREAFFAKNSLMGITELDLLATYKQDPDEFVAHMGNYDVFIIDNGCWDTFAALDARKRRDEADRPSRLVDAIIDKLHEARHAELPHIQRRYAEIGLPPDSDAAYRSSVGVLARIRRIDRRMIGLKLLEKSAKCVEQGRDRWFATAPMSREGATCVFVVSTADREDRVKTLQMAVIGASLKMNAGRVLGLATEPVAPGFGFSVDAFMIDLDPGELRTKLPPEAVLELEALFGVPQVPEGSEFEPGSGG